MTKKNFVTFGIGASFASKRLLTLHFYCRSSPASKRKPRVDGWI